MTSVKTLRVFEIKNGNNILAIITTFKSLFKLGDDVFGKITFPQKEINCLQVIYSNI